MACKPLVIASLESLFFSSGFCFFFRAETFFCIGYPPYIRDLQLPAKCPYQARKRWRRDIVLKKENGSVSCGQFIWEPLFGHQGLYSSLFVACLPKQPAAICEEHALTRRSTNDEDNLECSVRHSDGIGPQRYQQRRRSTPRAIQLRTQLPGLAFRLAIREREDRDRLDVGIGRQYRYGPKGYKAALSRTGFRIGGL